MASDVAFVEAAAAAGFPGLTAAVAGPQSAEQAPQYAQINFSMLNGALLSLFSCGGAGTLYGRRL